MVKLERSQSDVRYAQFIKAWEDAGLPDDAAGFTSCSEASEDVPMLLLPSPVVEAAAELIATSRVRGTNARRAAMMIAEPHAPGGHTRRERDPVVRRWVSIIDKTFFPFVHAFDKEPSAVTEDDLSRDFAFLEDVMRGVLAPLEHVAELDDLLAETRRQPSHEEAADLTPGDSSGIDPAEATVEPLQPDRGARGD